MPERKMLIVPAELVRKIDDNRGDLSQADFIDLLIESHLDKGDQEQRYVTREELQEFEQSIRDLLRSFLEFFVNYGLELGRQPGKDQFEELNQKLQGLGSLSKSPQERKAKIKL